MDETSFRRLSREMSSRSGAGGPGILLAVLLMMGMFLAWAALTELDNVTRGEGRLVPSLQNQIVQAAGTGVIRARHVSEGDRVEAGALLFEIDPVEVRAELEQAEERARALRLRRLRLLAEISGETPVFPEETSRSFEALRASELSLFHARIADLEGAIGVLEQRLSQRRQELAETRLRQETAVTLETLLESEIEIIAPLVERSMAPETQLLALRRQLAQLRADGDMARVAEGAALAGIAEIEGEILARRDRHRLEALQEMADVVARLEEIDLLLPSLRERMARTRVVAPMEGVVNQIRVRTLGAFVSAGDVLAEIVPAEGGLVVETRIDPADISGISPGDPVRIRMSAFDSARYGTVDGRVLRIGADAVVAPDTGLAHYLVDIALEGGISLADGTPVEFRPGMTATVDILTGRRTVLAYLWQPVARVGELALRD